MPGAFVSWILIVVVGVLILFSGFGDLMEARALSAVGAPFAGAGAVMALLTIAFGVLVVVSPFALVDLAFGIAGAGLVFDGVTELRGRPQEVAASRPSRPKQSPPAGSSASHESPAGGDCCAPMRERRPIRAAYGKFGVRKL